MQNTQVVSNSFGWVGVVGLALAVVTLIAMAWVNDRYASVNERYSFVVLQLQMMTERQNRAEQKIELLEIREQRRRENERNNQ